MVRVAWLWPTNIFLHHVEPFAREDDLLHRLPAGPGPAWKLVLGSWVLFQPERINASGTLQSDDHQR